MLIKEEECVVLFAVHFFWHFPFKRCAGIDVICLYSSLCVKSPCEHFVWAPWCYTGVLLYDRISQSSVKKHQIFFFFYCLTHKPHFYSYYTFSWPIMQSHNFCSAGISSYAQLQSPCVWFVYNVRCCRTRHLSNIKYYREILSVWLSKGKQSFLPEK